MKVNGIWRFYFYVIPISNTQNQNVYYKSDINESIVFTKKFYEEI